MLDNIKDSLIEFGDKWYERFYYFWEPRIGEDGTNFAALLVLLVLASVIIGTFIFLCKKYKRSEGVRKVTKHIPVLHGIFAYPRLSLVLLILCLVWFIKGNDPGFTPFLCWIGICLILGCYERIYERTIHRKIYERRLQEFYLSNATGPYGESRKIWERDITPNFKELLRLHKELKKEERREIRSQGIRRFYLGRKFCYFLALMRAEVFRPFSLRFSNFRYFLDKKFIYPRKAEKLRQNGFVLIPDGTGIAKESNTQIEIIDGGVKKVCNGFDIYGNPVYKN